MQHSHILSTTSSNEHTNNASLINNIYACMPIRKRERTATRTAWFSLAKDISLVLIGLRYAILVDRVAFGLEEARGFIVKLTQKFTEYPPLCVVVLPQQTLFIVSPTLLQERLSCGIQNDLELIQFVQVDRANKHPFMLDDVDHYSVFIKQFAAILDQLQQQVQRYTQYQSIVDITELVSDDMLIALTGWLLEYPAIYIQTSLSNGNCLASEPLWLIRAFARIDHEGEHDHLLHSFSVPCLLFDTTIQSTAWFKAWHDKWQQRMDQQGTWHQLRISIEQVTLPAVAL